MSRSPSCAVLAVGLVVAGCAVPYQPEPVRHAVPLPDSAFPLVRETVRLHYPRIEVADAKDFRVQSAWLPFQHGDVPGFRRASVYRGDDGRLRVIVEVYVLELHAEGIERSPVEGDRRAEQALAGAIERAIGH